MRTSTQNAKDRTPFQVSCRFITLMRAQVERLINSSTTTLIQLMPMTMRPTIDLDRRSGTERIDRGRSPGTSVRGERVRNRTWCQKIQTPSIQTAEREFNNAH